MIATRCDQQMSKHYQSHCASQSLLQSLWIQRVHHPSYAEHKSY